MACVLRWRVRKQGPKYLKIGAAVRYKPEDLGAWPESRPAGGEPVHPKTHNSSQRALEVIELDTPAVEIVGAKNA